MHETPLHDWHVKHNAEMIDYVGWHMPVWFKSIREEHNAVRGAAGIFDVSHMGRILITGQDAVNFLQKVTVNDVSTLTPLQAHYSMICNENGGIKDDLILVRIEPAGFILNCNALNRDKILEWLRKHTVGNVRVEDVTEAMPLFAIQGPRAQRILQRVTETDLTQLKRYRASRTMIQSENVLITRSGYTGEDGFEIYSMSTLSNAHARALKIWNAIMEAGESDGLLPCGLGARDSLRTEAGLPLYENEINEEINPVEAKLDFAVKMEKTVPFIGKDALVKAKSAGVKRLRIGFKLLERGSPRKDYPILAAEHPVGAVTSGLLSPLTGDAVGMGYVETAYAEEGQKLEVKIRDRNVKAKIISWPFYDQKRYGMRRETKS
jgi:glycine cleavage system T protein (aminomethyltransferase)